MRNPIAKRPTALVLVLSLVGYMIALLGPALAVGIANAANGQVIKNWNELGTQVSKDIDLSDANLPADANGRSISVAGNVTITGSANKTFKGLTFVVSEGHSLTVNNLQIDNTAYPDKAIVVAGDKNPQNRLTFKGDNTFTRSKASSENATKDNPSPLPLVQVKADTQLTIGSEDSSVLNLSNPTSPLSQAALIGTQHFSTFGTINIAGGTLNLQASSQSAAMIGSGGAFYEVKSGTNPSWLNNYDETPWSAGGTINITGGTINLDKTGDGSYGGAFIGAGRGAVKMPTSADISWAKTGAAVAINVSGGQINAHGNHTALGAGSFTTPMKGKDGAAQGVYTQAYAKVNISGGLVQVTPSASDTGNSAMNIGCRGVGNWNENFADFGWPLTPGCEVAISGGKVSVGTADSTLAATGDIAAIGSGPDSASVNVKISGNAQVAAYSNGRGAAIGGGFASGASTVSISDNAEVKALGVVRESPAIGAGGLPPAEQFEGNSRLDEDTARGQSQNQVRIFGNAQVTAETDTDSLEYDEAPNGAIGAATNRSGQVSISDQAKVTAKVFGLRHGAVIGSAGYIKPYVADPFKVTISGSPTVKAYVQPVRLPKKQQLGYGFGAAIGSGLQTQVPAQITLSGSPNLDLIGGQASSGVGLGFKSNGSGNSVTANLDAGAKIQVTSPIGSPRTDGSSNRGKFALANGVNMPLDAVKGKGQVLNLRFADGSVDGSGSPLTLGLTTAVSKLAQNQQTIPFSLVTPEGETVLSSALTSTLYNGLAFSVPKTGNYYLQSGVTPRLFAYHGDQQAEGAFTFPVTSQLYTQDGLLWAQGYSLKYQVAGEGGSLPQAYTTERYLPPNSSLGALPAVTLPTISGKTCSIDHWELNGSRISETDLSQAKLTADTTVTAVTKCEDTVAPPQPQPEKTTFSWQLQDGQGKALSGGQFTLTEKGGAAVNVPDSTSGTFTVNDLDPAKTYVLTQTQAPQGYELPAQTSYTVTFEKTSQGYQAKVNNTAVSAAAFVITNAKTPLPPQPVAFNWKLQDTKQNLLPGGTFKLVCAGKSVDIPATGTTSGTYSVTLDPTKGSCTLTQSNAPKGYKLGETTSYSITFVEKDQANGIWATKVNGKEVSTLTFTNSELPKPPVTTSFTWKLTDTAGKELNGGTFRLTGGKAPLTVTSQDAADPGVYMASNLDPTKTYTLSQITAPNGYSADSSSYQVTFVKSGESYKAQVGGNDLPTAGLVIKNTKLPTKAQIRWEVVSSADKAQYVPGTSFRVTPFLADGKTLDAAKSFIVTDSTTSVGTDLNKAVGQYRVVVPDGSLKYQVQQLTTSPDFGLKTPAQTVSFSASSDGSYSQIVEGSGLKFENTPVIKTKAFTWKLVDGESNPLSGGTFSLTNGQEVVPVAENKADSSFQATLDLAKTYTLKQTGTPAGFVKDNRVYTISFEGGNPQVAVGDTGVDLMNGILVIKNQKVPTPPPTTDPKPVSGLLTWKVLDSKGQAVAGTSFQVTPLGKDGKPAGDAFTVTDFVGGTTTFAVPTDPTDLDAATGAYKVKVDDVTLQYQLKQLTTAKGLQIAKPQVLSFSQGENGEWVQNSTVPFMNQAKPAEKPTTDPTKPTEPTSKPSEPSGKPSGPTADPSTKPNPAETGGATAAPSGNQNGGATEAPNGKDRMGSSSTSSSAPSSLPITGPNGATLALVSLIFAIIGAGLLAARKLREER